MHYDYVNKLTETTQNLQSTLNSIMLHKIFVLLIRIFTLQLNQTYELEKD